MENFIREAPGVPSRDTMEQIIKFGISNYLQMCVEAGFSQIQSHISHTRAKFSVTASTVSDPCSDYHEHVVFE